VQVAAARPEAAAARPKPDPVPPPAPAQPAPDTTRPPPPAAAAAGEAPAPRAASDARREGDVAPAEARATAAQPAPDVAPAQARAAAAQPAPDAAPASDGPRAPKAKPRNLLEQRLAETRAWLERVDPRHFSIQLLATDARQRRNLEHFLERRVRDGHLARVYVYQTRINGREWFGVLYGEFESVAEARSALRELPQALQRYQPFIRNVSDITTLG